MMTEAYLQALEDELLACQHQYMRLSEDYATLQKHEQEQQTIIMTLKKQLALYEAHLEHVAAYVQRLEDEK
jgi:hypothetical protein